MIQKNNETKSVTFNTNDDQPNYQQRLTELRIPPNTLSPHDSLMEKKVNGNNYASSSRVEDPITSFQARIQQPLTPPHKNNPPLTQPHSLGGRDRWAYAKYGGGRGERGTGRGLIPFPKYSTIHVKELKITATLDTHEDIKLDSDSETSVNCKEQISVMMKYLRESIMVDIKDTINENMKEFMRKITMSVRNDIKETLKDAMITHTKRGKKNSVIAKLTTRTNNPRHSTIDTKR